VKELRKSNRGACALVQNQTGVLANTSTDFCRYFHCL